MSISRGAMLVLALTGLVFLVQVYAKPLDPGERPSQNFALAKPLLLTGTFAAGIPASGQAPTPTRDVAPGYSALVAALARLDQRFHDGVVCHGSRQTCPPGYPFQTLVALQAGAMLAMHGLVFLIAKTLSGSAAIAATTTVLTLAAGRFAEFTRILFPYAIVTALSVLSCYLLLQAYRRKSPLLAATAGLSIGATAMFDSAYAPLAWLAAALIGVAAGIGARASFGRSAALALALLAGAFAVTGPWQLRNWQLFGSPAIAMAEPTSRLAERVSYNRMGPAEFTAALIAWLPGMGDGLSTTFFSEPTLAKITNYVPGSYLLDQPSILAAAETNTRANGSGLAIFERFIAGDPVGYLVSLVPILLRGLWATGSIFVIWGVVLFPLLIRRLAALGTLTPFVVASGPLFLMAVIQALVTPNFPWMNLGLVMVYAYVIAYVTGGVELPQLFGRKPS